MNAVRRGLVTLAIGAVVVACSPSSTPAPSPSPSAAPSGAVATPCEIVATEGPLRSTKLIGVSVESLDSGDAVIFRFGLDAPTSTNQPVGRLEAASPPFTHDPSGLAFDVPGTRFARVRFSGLVLYDAAGNPTFKGSERLDPAGGAAVRAVVREGEFEGVSSWIIGFDGTGCVTVGIGDATTTIIRVEVMPTP